MQHVMIDLETLGTSSDSVFLSIAALQFDLRGNTGDEFKVNININSALDAKRSVSGDTLKWWLEQKPEILKLMFENPKSLPSALFDLTTFIKSKGLLYPWGNSASFDLGMLAHAYNSLQQPIPWKFWNEKCFRSVWWAVSLIEGKEKGPKSDNAHDPMADCYYQVAELAKLELYGV